MVYAVIYRSFVKEEKEDQYQIFWKKIASYFVSERGAIGSTLHKSSEGFWVAYSRWPDKATRDASWSDQIDLDLFPKEIKEAIIGLKDCLDPNGKLPEISMEIIEEV